MRQTSESSRLKRRKRIRRKISGTQERPRLAVFRSLRGIYVQAIDDQSGRTLASASTLEKPFREDGKSGGNAEAAKKVGEFIAKRLLEQGIERAVFDRGGFIYHGRVKALAEAAREAGLKF